MAVRVCAYSALSLLLAAAACDKGDDARNDRQPPPGPPPAASSAGPAADVCAGGGGQDTDADQRPARSARGRAATASTRRASPRRTARRASCRWTRCAPRRSTASARCTSASAWIASSCSATSTAAGAPNSVEVNLSRFATADGAYAMFTKRVVADGDPAARHGEALAAFGAVGATSSSNAYVWRGPYLVELTFVTEDTKMTPEQMARAKREGDGRDRGGDRGPAARSDRSASGGGGAARRAAPARWASRTTRRTRSALSGIGPVAVGYYKDGDKRWRDSRRRRVRTRTARRRRFAPSSSSRGACRSRAWATRRCRSSCRRRPTGPRPSTSSPAAATVVAAVGDEELVLDPATPSEKQASLKLTHDEKLARLTTWLAK